MPQPPTPSWASPPILLPLAWTPLRDPITEAEYERVFAIMAHERAQALILNDHPANAAHELPFQEPTTYELVVNLKTAKMLGLVIPAPVPGVRDQLCCRRTGSQDASGIPRHVAVDQPAYPRSTPSGRRIREIAKRRHRRQPSPAARSAMRRRSSSERAGGAI